MRTIELKIFRFEELCQEAKEKARNFYRNTGLNYEPQIITEDMENTLEDLGYEGVQVFWRLTYSQGNGVAFYGQLTNPDKLLKRLLSEKDFSRWKRISEAVGIDIRINRIGSHYHHYNTMEVVMDSHDLYKGKYPFIETFLTKVEEKIQADVKLVSKKLERDGYKELEYQNSDEYIDMLLSENRYEYLEDGRRWVS